VWNQTSALTPAKLLFLDPHSNNVGVKFVKLIMKTSGNPADVGHRPAGERQTDAVAGVRTGRFSPGWNDARADVR
jgi:hypothetical protein